MEFHYYVPGCFQDPQADIELGKYAIEHRFEGVWIGDHFLPWLDNRPYTHQILPWLGAFMNEVPDCVVGTFVTCPVVRYEPPVLAQALATLDNMYPGRFELGVGTGEALNEAQFYDGEWPEWKTLSDMLVESLEIIDLLWETDTYAEYQGKHYTYDKLQLYTAPKTSLRTHWAAWGPQSAQRAGEHAGNLMTVSSPEHIEKQLLPAFRTVLNKTKRTLEDAHVATQMNVHVGDPNNLCEQVRKKGEHTPSDTELDNPDPRNIQATANTELAKMTDEEICKENNITNDTDDIVEQVEALEAAGVTRVIMISKVGDLKHTIDAVENDVMPAFE